jgi:hypothetical protein
LKNKLPELNASGRAYTEAVFLAVCNPSMNKM